MVAVADFTIFHVNEDAVKAVVDGHYFRFFRLLYERLRPTFVLSFPFRDFLRL